MSLARRILRFTWVALALAPLVSVQSALAQPLREVVVVPVGAPDASSSLSATESVERSLSNAHLPPIPLHDARDRFAARSRSPQRLTESDFEALSRAAHQAIEHVAFGRTAAAQSSVREVLTRAERALETLNRETATAREILDACLSLVRSTLQSGTREHALEQAMRCRQLVPDLVPDRASQPASVIGVLVEADDLLARMRIGHLTVRSAPKPDCAVYLNGRHLGTTPFELDRAAAGTYRVQVECGESPGRVHLVQLGDQPANLMVDTELDRAVRTDPRLLLSYADPQHARANAISGAISLGSDVGADDVIMVAAQKAGVELIRVNLRERRMVGRCAVPWSEQHGLEVQALERAISTLAEARVEGESRFAAQSAGETENGSQGGRPSKRAQRSMASARDVQVNAGVDARAASGLRAPPHASQLRRSGSSGRWRLALRSVALAAGTTSFVAAGIFAAHRHEAGAKLRSLPTNSGATYSARVRDWEHSRPAPYVFASIGSGALTAGALSLLRAVPRSAVSLWIPVASGLLGAGISAWGIAEVAGGGACPPSRLDRRLCSDDLERRDRGALMLFAALPLLAIPFTQLLRRAAAPIIADTALIYPEWNPDRRTFSLHASLRGL